MTLTQGAVPQWRDISTAPKDGSYIDLWCAPLDDAGTALIPCRVPNCFWEDGHWFEATITGPLRIWHRVTHWISPPPPPEQP